MQEIRRSGITLIALVVTIVILIILATISVNVVMNSGIIQKSQNSSEMHKIQAAREKLVLSLGNIQAEKIINKSYNQNEFLNKMLSDEIADVIIMGDTVIVDGYAFAIDRNVPKIGEYLGKGQANEDIKISGNIAETDNDTKAKLHIEITYEGEISEIMINGEKIEVPTSVNGIYSFDKEVTENGTYIVIGKEKNGGYQSEQIKVTNLAEDMEIWNKADMEKFRDKVNEGRSFFGRTVKLMEDIDLQNEMWVPIGNGGIQFKGEFNGNGKKVKGIYIDNSTENQALFVETGSEGIIKNLTTEGSITVGPVGAGIVSKNNGKIVRCTNKVIIASSGDVYEHGGIAGRNYGIIEECCNLANINAFDCVGGICGVNVGSVKKCYNIGTIYGNGWTVGGIVGHNAHSDLAVGSGYVYNCYNNAQITAGKTGCVGGIAGYNGWNYDGYIYNSYTVINTLIYGTVKNATSHVENCYTLDANTKLIELNAGEDSVEGTDTEQPWVKDTNNINGGYPILAWQVE